MHLLEVDTFRRCTSGAGDDESHFEKSCNDEEVIDWLYYVQLLKQFIHIVLLITKTAIVKSCVNARKLEIIDPIRVSYIIKIFEKAPPKQQRELKMQVKVH